MLDAASPLPLYHQLAELLRAGIDSGQWAPGSKLPSEPELARRFSIGRPTVRQATEVLVRRGLCERRRGSGTYVLEPDKTVSLFSLAGTSSSFQSGGLELVTRLLSGPELCDPRSIVELTGPPADFGRDAPGVFDGPAIHLRRLGSLHSLPVLVEELLLSSAIFPGLESIALEHASLSAIVREKYGLEPLDGEQRFHVARCPPAVAQALQLTPRQSVLLIERTLNFPGVGGAIFSRLYCRTDRISLSQKLESPTL